MPDIFSRVAVPACAFRVRDSVYISPSLPSSLYVRVYVFRPCVCTRIHAPARKYSRPFIRAYIDGAGDGRHERTNLRFHRILSLIAGIRVSGASRPTEFSLAPRQSSTRHPVGRSRPSSLPAVLPWRPTPDFTIAAYFTVEINESRASRDRDKEERLSRD